MKKLINYLKEELSAPANTMGMGNPTPAGDNGELGSEPLDTAKSEKEKDKKKKKCKDCEDKEQCKDCKK